MVSMSRAFGALGVVYSVAMWTWAVSVTLMLGGLTRVLWLPLLMCKYCSLLGQDHKNQ